MPEKLHIRRTFLPSLSIKINAIMDPEDFYISLSDNNIINLKYEREKQKYT